MDLGINMLSIYFTVIVLVLLIKNKLVKSLNVMLVFYCPFGKYCYRNYTHKCHLCVFHSLASNLIVEY
jgi:hypothetical protein